MIFQSLKKYQSEILQLTACLRHLEHIVVHFGMKGCLNASWQQV